GKFVPRQISEDLILIHLHHNITTELESRSKYICYFITGLLTGFGEYALYRVNVTESNCCLETDKVEACEFKIEKLI
ncbi:MAG: hypothetical protein ACFFAK_12585, partial [Promethearchaeota archaeon]